MFASDFIGLGIFIVTILSLRLNHDERILLTISGLNLAECTVPTRFAPILAKIWDVHFYFKILFRFGVAVPRGF